MYKDKQKQKEANRLAKARFDAKNKDSAVLAQKQGLKNSVESSALNINSNTLPVIPSKVIPGNTLNSNTLTLDQIIAIPAIEAKQILRGWAQDKSNGYQYRLGNLALQYDVIKSGYPLAHLEQTSTGNQVSILNRTSTSTGSIQC